MCWVQDAGISPVGDPSTFTPSLPDLSRISLSKTFLSGYATSNAELLQACQNAPP